MKLDRGVAVVGAGMTKFGRHADLSSRELFVDAFWRALASVDRNFEKKMIQALFLGNFTSDLFEHQGHTAPIMTDWVGLCPAPATRVEGACASGGLAFRTGVMAIASGLYDVVCVGGYEKMTTLPTPAVTDALACASDVFYEAIPGATFPGLYAEMAVAHMKKYGTKWEMLAKISLKDHRNGSLNPLAQFNKSIEDIAKGKGFTDVMQFLTDPKSNPVVAWPLRLFDCSPISDGAAATILVAAERAKEFTDTPVYVIGTGQGSASIGLHDRQDFTTLPSAVEASKQAYKMAGVTPEDIQIAEVHDCFTIAEVIATEDLGFFQKGEGGKAAAEGRTAREGDKPINTSGGLKCKGHPVGASGVAQIYEQFEQLRGAAGGRQVPDVELTLTHNVGGSGSTAVVHIFSRTKP
nr:thiolase domain-containing protein [Candidatus Njordarchaeum guaymaensis]